MHKKLVIALLAVAATANAYLSLTAANDYIFGVTDSTIYKFNYGDTSPVCYQPYFRRVNDPYQSYKADPSGRYLFTAMWREGKQSVYMIDTTTFEQKVIDINGEDVLGVDDEFVYTAYYKPYADIWVRKIKFTAAWDGSTEKVEVIVPGGMVVFGNGIIIARNTYPRDRYLIVRTDTMIGYELDLAYSTDFFASTEGISILVGTKLNFYDMNGAFLRDVDISGESGGFPRYWVDRVYGYRTVTNVEVPPLGKEPTSVLIKVDSNGEEMLPDDERLRQIHFDGVNTYHTIGVNGGTPYGPYGGDGFNGGVWRLYAGRIYKSTFASVTTLCMPLPETEAPVIVTQPPTEAPVPVTDAPVIETQAPETSAPETQAPETSAPETEEPTTTTTTVAPVPGITTTTTTPAPGVTTTTTTTVAPVPGVTTTTTTLAPGVSTTTTTRAPGTPTTKPNTTVKPNTPTTKVTTTKAVAKTTTSAPNKDVGPTNDPYITIVIKTSDATSIFGFMIVLAALLCQLL